MEIDIQQVIEAYNREIGILTQRAIVAETSLAARDKDVSEPDSI